MDSGRWHWHLPQGLRFALPPERRSLLEGLSDSEVVAQINLADAIICQDGFGIAFGYDLSFTDYVCFLTNVEGFANVMVGEQDADLFVAQVLDDFLDIADRDWVHTCEWFIQQYELGIGCECSGNLGTAPFTARQAHALVLADVFDMEFRKQSLKLLLAGILVEIFSSLENGHDVLFDGQGSEYRGVLRQVGQAGASSLVHRFVGYDLIINCDASRVGFYQPHDHVKASGLACAIGAQQADNLALLDTQGDIPDDFAGLEAFSEVLGVQHSQLLFGISEPWQGP